MDLSKWLDNQTITNISGIADINSLVQDGIINTLELNLKTEETALFDDDTIKVNGAFVYENEIINFSNPFSISVGPSSIVSRGNN